MSASDVNARRSHAYLELLGRPALRTPAGEELAFGKTFALLSYLALAPAPVSRDELAGLLWSDSEPARARQSVRQALSSLRKVLGEEVIDGEDPVRLRTDLVRVDVLDFEVALREDLRYANQFWRGPFMDGTPPTTEEPWMRWRDDVRARLDILFMRALVREGVRSREEGDAGRAVGWFRRASEVEPHAVRPRRELLSTLLDMQRFEDFDRAYADAARALSGIDAENELGGLLVRREEARRSTGGGSRRMHLPFVNREEEIQALGDAWARASSGEGTGVLLTGVSGVGKSRLVAEFLRSIQAPAVHGSGSVPEDDERTGGAVGLRLIERLRSLPGSLGTRPESDEVLEELVSGKPGLGQPDVIEAVLDLLSAVAYESPPVLIVDDFQTADDSSMLFVRRLLDRIEEVPCLAIIVYTGDDASTTAVLPALSRRIHVEPLAEPDLRQMVSGAFSLDAERTRELAGALFSLTSGNPLFGVEALQTLVGAGALRWNGREWRLDRRAMTSAFSDSGSVAPLILDRVQSLSAAPREIVRLLAAHDGPIEYGRLRRATHLAEGPFFRAARELVARGFVRWVGDRRLDFVHDRFREAGRELPADPLIGSTPVWRRRWIAAATIVAALGLSALGLAVEGGSSPLPDPGGVLVVSMDGGMEGFAPQNDGVWRSGALELPRPDSLLNGPFVARGPDGSPVWLSHERSMEEPPMIVRLHPGSALRDTLVRIPGDARVKDIHPDGRRALVVLEDTTSPLYRTTIHEISTDGSWPPRVAYDNGGNLDLASYGPFGEHILVLAAGRPDTALVRSLDGRTITSRTASRILAQDWCGPTQVAISGRFEPGGDSRLALWDLASDSLRWLESSIERAGNLACSPNGRFLVFQGQRGGEWVWSTLDLESGEVHDLELRGKAIGVAWLPDDQPTRPEGLRVSPRGSLKLAVGESRALSAELLTADESSLTFPVRWRSSDPWVLSVSQDGRVSGSSEGTAYAVAEYSTTIRDSLAVSVLGGGDRVVFRERFERLDPERWVVGGEPEAVADQVDGRPVLRLRGDGRWRDGIILREPLVLGAGLTVEAEVYLPLTQPVWQTVAFCLRTMTPPEDGDVKDLYRWSSGSQRYCVGWPAEQLARFAPDEVSFLPGSTRSFPELPLGQDWVHVGIQVRSDGRAAFILDRRVVSTTDRSEPIPEGLPWRVSLLGSAVDTDLLVRNLVVWRGARYRVGSR